MTEISLSSASSKLLLEIAAPLKLLAANCGCEKCPLVTFADHVLNNCVEEAKKAFLDVEKDNCGDSECGEACQKVAFLIAAQHDQMSSKLEELSDFTKKVKKAELIRPLKFLCERASKFLSRKTPKLPKESFVENKPSKRLEYSGQTKEVSLEADKDENTIKQQMIVDFSSGASFTINRPLKCVEVSESDNLDLKTNRKLIGSFQMLRVNDSKMTSTEKCNTVNVEHCHNIVVSLEQETYEDMKYYYSESTGLLLKTKEKEWRLPYTMKGKPDKEFKALESVPDHDFNLFKTCA